MTPVVLASASPRRQELLSQIGVQFTVRAPDIDETPGDNEPPDAYVRRLALAKAAAVDVRPDELVIAADTTVDLGGDVLGKPVDDDEATSMLRRLSARTHRVHTGIAVRHCGDEFVEVCTTLVTFVTLDAAMIEWYVGTGEAQGKAGAFAIQGAGGALVKGVRGSVSNVVGFPLHLVIELAARCGINLLSRQR